MRCAQCGAEFQPWKDFYITVNERKGPSRNLCSLPCTITYINDED